MLFNSYAFLLVFLPTAILVYRVADNYPAARTWVLIGLSMIFYSYWDIRFLPLMLASILANWWVADFFVRTGRRAFINGAIVTNLAVLGVFKYTNFFADTFSTLFGMPLTHLNLILPLGISFFTFHHIMYLVDLGRGKAPFYPLDRYALYICFFPQAIAGPIARWNEVVHQFGQRAFAAGWERRCAIGVAFIVIGLLQKTMLADPIARGIDPIYQRALTGPITNGDSWMAFAVAFQIFFDFAAYSDIAIGLGYLFGIQLPRNFDGPFRATSILLLWQRWHMTLTRFLRDYLFTPLSHVRIGGHAHRMTRLLAALILTMALCGLWHGAGWNYILWGTLQGLAMIVALAWRKAPPIPSAIAWILTIGFFIFTAVIFRSGSIEAALRIYQGLAAFPATRPQGIVAFAVAGLCATVLPPTHVICSALTQQPRPWVAVGLGLACIAILTALGADDTYVFVYFQF